jgi:hypothetical protein
MNLIHPVSRVLVSLLLVGIATWWIVAPRSYVACIRRLPMPWMSTYPMNTKTWFTQYLRAFGLMLWMLFLVGFFYWGRGR